MKDVLARAEEGNLIRRAGVVGIVSTDGIRVQLPSEPYESLKPVYPE